MAKQNDLMEKIVALCKRRGFVFPGSEIYGGLANTYDFGPLGVELKNNIKQLWWKMFVHERDDIVGLDASIIMNSKVWEKSGHVKEFSDPLVECKKCQNRFRWDHVADKMQYPGPRADDSKLGPDEDVLGAFWICENCGKKNFGIETKGRHGDLIEKFGGRQFNLMFKTHMGPVESTPSLSPPYQGGEEVGVVYLRPETAQAMFVDFKNIVETTRVKIPFGVAQIGKAFRNEITPGNFIFRTREFEQMEIEYFVQEKDWKESFEDWLKEMKRWIKAVGIDEKKVEYHEIPDAERAHYSKRTIDVEFKYPFGQGELYGLAYRTDYDLKAHGQEYRDQETGEKFIPHVIEPSLGVERTALAVLLSAYEEEKDRVVLKLSPKIAPYQVAVFPLLKNKPQLVEAARKIYQDLKLHFRTTWDDRGNIGKRYYSQDEIGTPFCVTVDFDSLEDKKVTVRDRDSKDQPRIEIGKLVNYISSRI